MMSKPAATKRSLFSRISQGPVPWLIPIGVVLLLLFVYPTIEVIRYSFTNASILTKDFVYTFGSYRSVFTNPHTYSGLRTTVIFVFFSVIFQVLIGLIVALAVDKGEELRMHGTVFVRVATMLSWAIPGSIVGIIWKLLYVEDATGILITALKNTGLNNISFLTQPASALVCVIIANIWRGSAQSMILSYSGLKTIPKDIIEAANMDGANAWQRFRYVTLPAITPVLSINAVLSTIATFNTFDMIMSLSAGGPGRAMEVLALTTYNTIFGSYSLGRGSAYATLLLLTNVGMGVIYFTFLKKRSESFQ